MSYSQQRWLGGQLALVIVATGIVSGCSVGPQTVPRDRSAYAESMAQSAREQLLLNIVRLRYLESPMFLSVTSVVNQYSLEGTVSANSQWNWGSRRITPDSSVGVGANGRYSDRPTITYAPMIGRKFTESVMTPMQPQSVLALIESGWKVNTLFPLTVHSVNGIRNRFFAGASSQTLDPRFKQIVDLMAQMQEDGTLSIRVQKSQDELKPGFVMLISGAKTEEEVDKIVELKKLLGVDPDADRYKIVFGSVAKDPTEIAIVTRSILAILADMSSYVRVPDQDIAEGRALPGSPTDDGLRHPLVIHCGDQAPDDAYAAIPHRDRWYFISDRDLYSKRTMVILQLLMTLAESPDSAQTPLLTIPAGG